MTTDEVKQANSDETVESQSKIDFDIEKYRIQYPMDYLKAMEMIKNIPDVDEVFKIIYQVTRLHIPDILYKYYSLSEDDDLNELKLKTLRCKQVYMSDIKSLNDPFDNKAYFYKNEDILLKYKDMHAHNNKLLNDLSSFMRVSSFTANGVNCMPMWAHYSNNHKGFCVSYVMKNNQQLSPTMFPVQYSDKRIDITSIMEREIGMVITEQVKQMAEGKKKIVINDLTLAYIISFFGNIKHESWRYENEYRCSTGANAKGMPYMPAIPHEMYIGKDCSSSNKEKLVDIAYELNIPIFQMIFDECDNDFKLSYQRIP